MKILLISSSPRKKRSQTFALAKEVVKGFGSSAKTEVIHLCDNKIEFCRHCEACHKKIMSCPIKDDVHNILKKILSADGIILATPNYINQITASMKALLERASHFIHCKRLLGKYIVGVVSSGSGNDQDVLNYIKHYAHTCGAQYSGGISSRASDLNKKIGKAQQLGKKFFKDIKDKEEYPDQIKIIEEGKAYFKKIIQLRKAEWREEYKYWQEKNWL